MFLLNDLIKRIAKTSKNAILLALIGGIIMEKIIVLGTGNATVKNCYNTCFALKNKDEYFLVDAGGGNQILHQLDQKQIQLEQIHHLFVTHEHTDHLLGVIWVIRMIATKINQGKYQDNLTIYAHTQLVQTIKTICNLTLQKKLTKWFDDRIVFVALNDGDQHTILGQTFTFFDILSTKAKQFGFTFVNANQKIVFTGDEPFNPDCDLYVEGANWLLSEAFCLYDQRDEFKPYEKHHSTALDAAILASKLGVDHLILWHTEEKNLKNRKELYTKEAKQKFNGKIYVPDDLEEIDLC